MATNKHIDEKTFVPLSLVVLLISGLVWFFVFYSKDMRQLSDRLSRIEGKLGIYMALDNDK